MLLGVLPPDWLPKLLFVCFLACIVASQFVSERTATYTQPLTLLAYVPGYSSIASALPSWSDTCQCWHQCCQ